MARYRAAWLDRRKLARCGRTASALCLAPIRRWADGVAIRWKILGIAIIGGVMTMHDGLTLEDVLRAADGALYQAKS